MMILVKVTQARCVLTTNFWTSGYAALPPFVVDVLMSDWCPTTVTDSHGQTSRPTRLCTKRHTLRLALIN